MVNQDIKQVIVMRHDLKMRLGKQISQGAHSSIHFLADIILYRALPSRLEIDWLEQGMTKIVVRVESEEELLDIYQKAKAAKLTVHLITDAGLTEFHGVPTKTCLAIGPDRAEAIDKITGDLKLL